MIPVVLRIKNFLSYGPETQTIDFGPYPLICMSGKNGHGKSALLDAITWSLWGQARKVSGTAKPDQGLLHLGQTHMMVSFDFICNNTMYRVKREFTQTYGKPLANLEFGILENDGDKWIPLTSKTIRGTQEIIENTLHITFDSFINSAFLRQGQSHEFSTKSPKERKEILASILGLQEYERVRKYALEKVKEFITQKNTVVLYQEKIQTELQKKDAITTQLATLTNEFTIIAHQEADVADKERLFQQASSTFQQERSVYEVARYQQEQLLHKKNDYSEKLQSIRLSWRSIQRLSKNSNAPHALEERKQNAIKEVALHQHKLQSTLALKEQSLVHKNALHAAEKEFDAEYSIKIQEQRMLSERLRIQTEHLAMQYKAHEDLQQIKKNEYIQCMQDIKRFTNNPHAITKLEEQKQYSEKQFEKRKNFYHQYRSQGTWTANELEALRQKQALSHDESNPSCPLCEQNLSASRKKFLHSKFISQEKFLTHRLKRLSKLVSALKDILLKQHAELETLKKTLDEDKQQASVLIEREKTKIRLEQELNDLEHKKLDLERHALTLKQEEALATIALEKLNNQKNDELLTYEPYRRAQYHLNAVLNDIKQQEYNADEHKKTAQALAEIENELNHCQQLHQEQKKQEERKQEIHYLCLELKKINAALVDLGKQSETFLLAQQNFVTAQKQHAALIQQLKIVQAHKELLLQQKGSLELEQKRMIILEEEFIHNKTIIDTCEQHIEDLQTIAIATSKEGVQALLIEQILPEIEYEANALLGKLTNNQAHIMIESLRDLKKGGSKETLDIKISDAVGIRPYELFSGGEAFRIDFALRIAISKLLARRAGTSLQILIIDEGFGSQDEDGLSHIMDAIYKIQDDFAKVIIVSHLPSMKENFPVHFCVEKKAHGSVVSIIEQE